MSDIVETALRHEHEDDAIAFVLGHGETYIGHWFAQGHVVMKFARALEPKEPGTVVTGVDTPTDPSVPPVWLLFEDATAVRRLADYLNKVADDLVGV